MTNPNPVANYEALVFFTSSLLFLYFIFAQQSHLIPEDFICRGGGWAVSRHHIVAIDCFGDGATFPCRYGFHGAMTAFRYPVAGWDVRSTVYNVYPPKSGEVAERRAAETGGIVC